jgi:predicted metal-dependent TIM-barrel fold hydrolase
MNKAEPDLIIEALRTQPKLVVISEVGEEEVLKLIQGFFNLGHTVVLPIGLGVDEVKNIVQKLPEDIRVMVVEP